MFTRICRWARDLPMGTFQPLLSFIDSLRFNEQQQPLLADINKKLRLYSSILDWSGSPVPQASHVLVQLQGSFGGRQTTFFPKETK